MQFSLISALLPDGIKKNILKYSILKHKKPDNIDFDDQLLMQFGPSIIRELEEIYQNFNKAYALPLKRSAKSYNIYQQSNFYFSEKYQMFDITPIDFIKMIVDLHSAHESIYPHKYQLQINIPHEISILNLDLPTLTLVQNGTHQFSIQLFSCASKSTRPPQSRT